jgi:N-acetyl sugar amidotransferase
MNHCARCLYPKNHPLGIVFDNQGICSGCRVHEEKDSLNWSKRLEKIKLICEQYRNKNRSSPDCIVPVSGGRDSYFIVDFVINELKMRPLLVNYNSHYNTQIGIRNLSYLKTCLGVDLMQCTVSPSRVKKITRETLRLRGSMYWHILAGQTVFPVKTAVQFKVPLIIWGAHQGVDQVGMFSHEDEVEMTRKYRKEHDLMNLEAEDLLYMSNILTAEDIEQYTYPSDKELDIVGVKGIYLNNYVRWDSKKQHEKMIEKYNYETMVQQKTFDTYNDVDSFHYSGIHDEIKMMKHGYGKVSDHVAREIRLKRMTYEEGYELIKKYNNIQVKDLELFLNWIEMSQQEYYSLIKKHHQKIRDADDIISHISNTQMTESNLETINNARLNKQENCEFRINSKTPQIKESKYVLIGRGWVD